MKPESGSGYGVFGCLTIAALVVPAVLFYNWRTRLKADSDRGVAVQPQSRPQGKMFQTPAPQRLVNPIAQLAPPARGGTVAPGAAVAPRSPAAAPAVSTASSASASAAGTLVLSRDPMLSPVEQVRIREMAYNQAHPTGLNRRPRRVRKAPIEERIQLQGIVANSSSGDSLAIIDGLTVKAGQDFPVRGYPGKVRVLKISSTTVVLGYKGRKIKLTVSQ